jgi:hypothetical protein
MVYLLQVFEHRRASGSIEHGSVTLAAERSLAVSAHVLVVRGTHAASAALNLGSDNHAFSLSLVLNLTGSTSRIQKNPALP